MGRVLVAVAVLSLAVTAAGCGSKKSSSPPASSATQSSSSSSSSSSSASSSSSSSSSSGSATSFASAKNCKDLEQLGVKFSQAIAANGGDTSSEAVAKAYATLADAAPSEIKGDFKTLATAFSAYLDALKKAGYKPGTTPTAAQIAALSKASKAFTDPKLQAAEQHLTTWVQKNCAGLAPKP